MIKSLRYALLAGTAMSLFVQPANAQSNQVEEVVVTAQRKTERLQDVPIAVNVISGEALANKGVDGSVALEDAVPGLTMQSQGPALTPFLRGIGALAGNPNSESSVAVYIDGVYLASLQGIDMDLNNLDRIEVLKGPQGTLFGRNATGGVIQLVTRDPSHTPLVEGAVGYGNYNTATTNFYGTTGLTDKLAMDFAFMGSFQGDGWGTYLATGKGAYKETQYSMRSKLLFTPSDNTTIKLAWDKEFRKEDQNVSLVCEAGTTTLDSQLLPPVTGFVCPSGHNYDPRMEIVAPSVPHPSHPSLKMEQQGISLNIEHNFGFAKLVSISAYRQLHGVYFPSGIEPLPVINGSLPSSQQQVSQEIQLLSPSTSKVDWILGYFYFDNNAGYRGIDFAGLAFADPPFSGIGHFNETGVERKRSHSVYAQDTISLLPSLKFTTGLRFTHERSSVRWSGIFSEATGSIPALTSPDIGYDKLTWRVALDQRITSDIHAYASYNRGVNGGGFNLLAPGDTGFSPEILDAYELGLKSELFDHHLRLNVALFKYFYNNIQVQVVPLGNNNNPGSNSNTVETLNAGKAQLEGIDLDFAAVPVRNLTVSGGLTFIHDRYKSFPNAQVYGANPTDPPALIDASGKKLLHTPTFSANLGVDYKIESSVGDFPLSVNYSYNGGYAMDVSNRFRQQAYYVLNLQAGWNSPDGHYGIVLWGRNVTNAYYIAGGASLATGDTISPAAPATYGIIFKTRWGG